MSAPAAIGSGASEPPYVGGMDDTAALQDSDLARQRERFDRYARQRQVDALLSLRRDGSGRQIMTATA